MEVLCHIWPVDRGPGQEYGSLGVSRHGAHLRPTRHFYGVSAPRIDQSVGLGEGHINVGPFGLLRSC